MRKRILSMFVAVCMVVSFILAIPINASAETGTDIVAEARRWLGTPYGHSNGSGGPGTMVDCSGLVLQVYQKFGYNLPWTVEGYGNVVGQKDLGTEIINNIPSKDYSNLQEGDLIVFHGHSGNTWHIGIYSGNGYVINAQSSGVKEAYLSNYWYQYAVGVRRILTNLKPTQNYVNFGTCFYGIISSPHYIGMYFTNDGDNVSLRKYTGSPNQIWYFNRNNDGSYTIKSISNGKCMEVAGIETRSNVQVYSDNDTDAQKWFFTGSSCDYTITSKRCDYVIDISGCGNEGDNIQIFMSNDTQNQKFALEIIDNVNLCLNMGNDFYGFISNPYGAGYLTNDGNRIFFKDYDGCVNQIWHFIRNANGSYTISSALDEKYIQESGILCGDSIDAFKYTGESDQKWFLLNNGTYCTIKSEKTGYSIEVNAENTLETNYTNYLQNQTFAIEVLLDRLEGITISFDSNGGMLCPQKQMKYGAYIYLSEEKPKRTGYIFKSWNTNADGSGQTYYPRDIYNGTEDITLYAQWEAARPYTKSVVTKSSGICTVEAELYNFVAPCDILVVGYKNKKFITLKTIPYDKEKSSCTLEGNIDEIKVMVWNSLLEIMPLCDAEKIPSSEWITE